MDAEPQGPARDGRRQRSALRELPVLAAVTLDETYLFEDDSKAFCEAGGGGQCSLGAPGVLVPDGRLWVMGDHRSRSGDSRANRTRGDGTIGVDQVVGRAFVVAWPLSRRDWLTDPVGD